MTITAEKPGFLTHIDTMALGFAGIQLGAGRRVISDVIDYSSGMYIHKKLGDKIAEGEELITIHTNAESALQDVSRQMKQILTIKAEPAPVPLLIVERIADSL